MAGHSKWAQIKHKKAITDKKKGQLFSKLAKAITVAARGNPDPKNNISLRSTIENARSYNMPNENIERALSRAAAQQDNLQEIVIEAMGPGASALIITAITDNRNRTITEIRTLLGKHGARMVQEGSLLWMFTRTTESDGIQYTSLYPLEIIPDDQASLQSLLEILDDHDDIQDVYTNAKLSL